MFKNVDWKLGLKRTLVLSAVMSVVYIVLWGISENQWKQLEDDVNKL